MRTPDSDSNHQSDDPSDDPTLSINTHRSNPVIEIHYKKTTKTITKKSHIPVAVFSKNKATQSEPSSPKTAKVASKLYKSSPNLNNPIQDHSHELTKSTSRIPTRSPNEHGKLKTGNTKIKVSSNSTSKEKTNQKMKLNKEKSVEMKKPESKDKEDDQVKSKEIIPSPQQVTSKVKNENSEKDVSAIELHPKQNPQTLVNHDKNKLKPSKSIPQRRNSRDIELYSPIPVHNEIEVFHNLTRSPERKQSAKLDEESSAYRHITTADDVLLTKTTQPTEVHEDRRVRTADVADRATNKTTNNQLVFINNYNSFHVYNNGSAGRHYTGTGDPPIPTRDNGECLTCSSSGSDIVADRNGYEAIGELSERILIDIQSRVSNVFYNYLNYFLIKGYFNLRKIQTRVRPYHAM